MNDIAIPIKCYRQIVSNSAIWRSIALDIEFQLSVKNQQIFMNDIAIPKMLNNE